MTSSGPPQLWREPAQPDEKCKNTMKDDEGGSTLSWADAQEQFSLEAGAMSQGSGGSPVNFLDPETCDDILKDLRRADGFLFVGGMLSRIACSCFVFLLNSLVTSSFREGGVLPCYVLKCSLVCKNCV